MNNTISVILAGGKGKRMDILCYNRPKPALPFAGRYRVIDFPLCNSIHSHVPHIAVIVDHQRKQIEDYLEKWTINNKLKINLEILKPLNGSFLGTADAIYQNFDYLKEKKPKNVLILAGDHVYRMDYRKMKAFHEKMKADITIGVTRVPTEQAHRFGLVKMDHRGKVVEFVEKPEKPDTNLASMGIYLFNSNVLSEWLIDDSRQRGSAHDFGHNIFPRALTQSRVYAFKFDQYWQDIGTIEAYYSANMKYIKDVSSLTQNGRWPIIGKDNGNRPSNVFPKANVRDSYIGADCTIKGNVENSIIYPGVTIGEQTLIKNSIIMENAVLGKHSIIENCIIDERAFVDDFCYIGFGSSLHSDNITIIGNKAMIPAGVAIGHNSKVLPSVEPDDFLAHAIPSGSIVPQKALAGVRT